MRYFFFSCAALLSTVVSAFAQTSSGKVIDTQGVPVASFGETIPIDRAWNISFPESDPPIPGNFFTGKPQDWTKLRPEAAKVNFGTALYTSAIDLLHPEEADDWILDLGDVHESARIFVNGQDAGTARCAPFRINIGAFLKPGINLLEVYVTNLRSNRIAAPSGLCSEVNLIPVYYDVPSADEVIAQARLVNDYFMQKYPDPLRVVPFPSRRRVYESNIWTRGVYYEGLMALYDVDPQQRYLDYTMDWGDKFNWDMRNGKTLTRNADNYCCSQAYIDMYRIYGEDKMIANVTKCMENILATPEAVSDWTWIDAIQMGMPALVKYGVTMQKPEYFEKAWQMYEWARERFLNKEEGLWWRDKDFCPPYTTPNGKNCYWARGNGWVVAALVRVLSELPADDAHRAVYEQDFRDFCRAIVKYQRADGTWNPSVADPDDFGGPEATGTSLFLYGLAWGVNTGRLDAAEYGLAVARGWNGLNRICIHPNGFIGYSQGSGKEPKEAQPVTYDRIPDFEDFGTGCYLLAASEVSKLRR